MSGFYLTNFTQNLSGGLQQLDRVGQKTKSLLDTVLDQVQKNHQLHQKIKVILDQDPYVAEPQVIPQTQELVRQVLTNMENCVQQEQKSGVQDLVQIAKVQNLIDQTVHILKTAHDLEQNLGKGMTTQSNQEAVKKAQQILKHVQSITQVFSENINKEQQVLLGLSNSTNSLSNNQLLVDATENVPLKQFQPSKSSEISFSSPKRNIFQIVDQQKQVGVEPVPIKKVKYADWQLTLLQAEQKAKQKYMQ